MIEEENQMNDSMAARSSLLKRRENHGVASYLFV
jgi:hypothetical protein